MLIKGIYTITFSLKVIALYFGALLIIGILIIIIFYKAICSRKIIKNLTQQCDCLQIEIEQLKKISEKKEQEIVKIKVNLKQVKENTSQQNFFVESIISGVHTYVNILENKNLSQLKVEELSNFIKFYTQIDTDFSLWFMEKERLLTHREVVICILMRMGKEKPEIIDLLRCSDGSYRTLKNRIKSKLCIDIYKCEIEEYMKHLY